MCTLAAHRPCLVLQVLPCPPGVFAGPAVAASLSPRPAASRHDCLGVLCPAREERVTACTVVQTAGAGREQRNTAGVHVTKGHRVTAGHGSKGRATEQVTVLYRSDCVQLLLPTLGHSRPLC